MYSLKFMPTRHWKSSPCLFVACQSLAKSNLTLVSWPTHNRGVLPVNDTNASLSHFANLKFLGAAALIASPQLRH